MQNILWHKTKDWPELVRNKDVFKLYKSLGLGISYDEFLSLFIRSTGYVKAGNKFKRVAYFKDDILREIALEIWSCGEAPNSYTIHVAEDELVNLTLSDTRFLIASEILTTMHQMPYLKGRIHNKEDFLNWNKRIAEAIPDSPRWKQIYRNRDEIFRKFEDLHNLEDSEYELLNICERETEFRIFTDVYDKEECVREIFSKFLNEIGIHDLMEYENLISNIGKLFSTLYLYLTEEIPEISSEDRRVRRSKLFTYEEIEKLMSSCGLSPDSLTLIIEKLTLTIKKLKNLVLQNLPHSLIPIFYEDRDGWFRINTKLLQLNNFLELCLSLREAEEEVVNKFKGDAFERILAEILTGKVIILYEKSKIFSGSLTTTDEINLDNALKMLRKYGIETEELRYSYRPPEGITLPRITIDRDSHPAFSDFLNIIGKEKTDIDILLIHEDEPKHVIIVESEFTRKYSPLKYSAKVRFVKKLEKYLSENPNAKKELHIPIDYPLVPVLVTSFSGGIFRKKDGVIKTTFPPILWGKFREWVTSYLENGNF